MKGYKRKLVEFAAKTKMTEDDLKNPNYKPALFKFLHLPLFEGNYKSLPQIDEMIAQQLS